jgi:hypothetical protein
MLGHLLDEAVEDYVMRRLTDPELQIVEEHLMLCRACQQRVEVVDALQRGLRQFRDRKRSGESESDQ